MRANELKRGDLVDFDGQCCLVKKIDTRSPSARGASTLYKIRLDNLVTGQKKEINVKGDFLLSELNSEKLKVQFSYQDGGQYFFMNLTDFNQYVANESMLAGKLQYLSEGLEAGSADGSPWLPTPTPLINAGTIRSQKNS